MLIRTRRAICSKMRWLGFCTLALLFLTRPSTGQDSLIEGLQNSETDSNRRIYFKHKLEFSLDTGWLPNNIPFIFDPFMGEKWDRTPLDYTLGTYYALAPLALGEYSSSFFYTWQYGPHVQSVLHRHSARA